MTYESRSIRHMDELTKMSQEADWGDAEEHWHFGLASSAWSIEDIGRSVLITKLYICKREGRPHHLEGESEANSEEKRGGISLE